MLLIGMKLSALTLEKRGLEGYYEVRDLWEREDLGSVDKIVTKVKSHGVKLYKLSKKQV